MGLCHSVSTQESGGRRSRVQAQHLGLAPVNPASAEPASSEVCFAVASPQQHDFSCCLQSVRLQKVLATAGESGCLACPGFVTLRSSIDGAQHSVTMTFATRYHLHDDAVERLQRLAGRTIDDGLLMRLAFFSEHLSVPPSFRQRSSSSRLLACNGQSYAAVEQKAERSSQWSSCPAINTLDQKDVSVVCISGPCLPNNTSRSLCPTTRLAAQNADIADVLTQLPLLNGHTLVACIDELPDSKGNMLQVLQSLQNWGNPHELTDTLLMYALEVAQAVAALHLLGVHHGALTPAAVLLVPVAKSAPVASLTPPSQPPTAAAAASRAAVPAAAAATPGALASDVAAAGRAAAPVTLRCKLGQYGLVNPVEHASRLALNASGWGAVSYMAPECFTLDPASVTHEMLARMDAHAFGSLCYHLFTGAAPHHERHVAQVLVGLTAGEGLELVWPAADGRRPRVPNAVRQLVARCLDRRPEARPSFPELVAELQSVRKQHHRQCQQEQRRRQLLQQHLHAPHSRTGSPGPLPP